MTSRDPKEGVTVRPEQSRDVEAIRRLNLRAFGEAMGSEAEAELVDTLREQGKFTVSLVAVLDDRVVGHILFTPMTFDSDRVGLSAVGLAPMAVLPELQRQGVGSLLVDAGLEACREAGHHCVFVLGHPEYYPRFGLRPASVFAIRSSYDVPDEAFMGLELRPGALSEVSGTVRYQSAFDGI